MSQKKFAGLVAVVLATGALLTGCGSDEPTSYTAEQEKAIAERIAPVGEVAMEGSEIASAPVAAPAASGPRSGEDIYKKSCFACHATGAAGAPKYAAAGDWEPRMAKGVDTLYENALKGFNAMPAKGNCFDCSDEEVIAAVDYILVSVQ